LLNLPAKKNVTLPLAPGDEQQKLYNDVLTKKGADLAKEYVSEMMKAFAQKTVPTLRMHLSLFEKLQTSLTSSPYPPKKPPRWSTRRLFRGVGSGLLSSYGRAGFAEANAHVRGVVAHLAILNHQQLGRLVLDAELAGKLA